MRAFTRLIEFDFVSWTLEALSVKIRETALGTATYISGSERSELVLAYLELVDHIRDVENRIDAIFSDPNVQDPMADSRSLRTELNELRARQAQLGQLAESTLQHQLSQTLAELGLAFGGQSIPPVLYRTTPLPSVLIVSPRDTIRQAANISLHPDLTIDERESLEDQVDQDLNVSSLVVSVGGIGLYPSMVIGTSDINTLSEIVAHEWIHNFLTLRPLGINVFASAELLTMNETTANIAGKEIGRALVAQHYPEFLPPPEPEEPAAPTPEPELEPEPPAFDFRAEMRITRLTVDELLVDGKIEEAEAYMEARRRIFWEHGHPIRKLNQAYFAFHGSYADQPGGPAGDDPVGSAVRTLRGQSGSLAEFVKRISWISSFEQLQTLVGR